MKVSTAMALMIGGLALAQVRDRRFWATMLAMVTMAIAILGWYGQLDHLTPEMAQQTIGTPGRISHISAACLLMLSCAVIALVRGHPHISGILATVSASLTVLGVIAYSWMTAGLIPPAIWLTAGDQDATTIAAPTAVLLLLYSFGVMHETLRMMGQRWTQTR